MIAILAAALALLHVQAASPSGQPDDPMLGATLSKPALDPATLHARLRSEARDLAWAPATETALRAIYSRTPGLLAATTELRVICGSSLCEVAATLRAEPASGDVITRLQDGALTQQARTLGLEDARFGVETGKQPKRVTAIAYWSRAIGASSPAS